MKITSSYFFNNDMTIETVDAALSITRQGYVHNGSLTLVHASTWDNIVDTAVTNDDNVVEVNRATQRSRKAKNAGKLKTISTYYDNDGCLKMQLNGDTDTPIDATYVQRSFDGDYDGRFTVDISRHDNDTDDGDGDIRNVVRIANGYNETPDATDIDLHMESYEESNGDRFVNLDSEYCFRGNKKLGRTSAEFLPTLSEYRILYSGSSLWNPESKSDNDAHTLFASTTFDVDDFGFVEDLTDVSFIIVEKRHAGLRPAEKITWKETTKIEYADDGRMSYHTSVVDVTEGLRTDDYSSTPAPHEYRFFQTKDGLKVMSYRSGNSATSPCSYDFSIIYKNDAGDEEVYLVRKYLESEDAIDFDVYSSLEKLAYIKECYVPDMSSSVWEFDAPSNNVSTAKCYAYIAFGPEFINSGSINPETAPDRLDAFRRLSTFISNFSLFTTKTSDPVVQESRYIIESFGRFIGQVSGYRGNLDRKFDREFKRDILAFWKREIEILTIEPHYGKSIRNIYDNIDVCTNYAISVYTKNTVAASK